MCPGFTRRTRVHLLHWLLNAIPRLLEYVFWKRDAKNPNYDLPKTVSIMKVLDMKNIC